ncbi:MAG: hypothetical protein IPN29_00320 [Saprospiraceae bacterium]|nr:hypothetical protein [Saprospiraceae bacterium]
MKTIFILLFLFFEINSSAQYTKILNGFKKETVRIMNILSIPMRTHLEKDDSLIIILKNDFSLNARFDQDKIGFIQRNGVIDTGGRWYISPKIFITPLLDSIISKKIDTSKNVYARANSAIIHELTHYFQKTYFEGDYFEPSNNLEYNKYITQQIEFEAYAVNSYYYLNIFKKKKLKKIMRTHMSMNERLRHLINSYWKEAYPWRPLPF